MKRLSVFVAVAATSTAVLASVFAPGAYASQPGKDLTLRSHERLCGGFYPYGDQALIEIGCGTEAAEPEIGNGYYVVGDDRCFPSSHKYPGRPIEMLRTFEGSTSVVLTVRSGNFQAVGALFTAPGEGGFPPGTYTARIKRFSFRTKVWKPAENKSYTNVKIICEPAEVEIGSP